MNRKEALIPRASSAAWNHEPAARLASVYTFKGLVHIIESRHLLEHGVSAVACKELNIHSSDASQFILPLHL